MASPIVLIDAKVYAAAAAGLISHLAFFIRGEHHLQAPALLNLSMIVPFTLFVGQIQLGYSDARQAATMTALMFTAYVVSLFTSMIVYRTFFHQLKNFPGPPMAKISKFWHVSKDLTSENWKLMDKLHKQYGDFVRTGPNEITIFRAEAQSVILGPGSKCIKSEWYDIMLPLVALNTVRDKPIHDKRRRIWDHGFSAKALHDYDFRVKTYSEQLERRISEFAGKPVNVTNWFNFFSFDIMGDLAFGKSFDMLKDGKEHFAVQQLKDGTAALGPLTPVPWLFILCAALPGLTRDWKKMLAWSSEQVHNRIKTEVEIPDIMSWLIDASKRNNSLEKDKHWLEGDSLLIIIAGSDTTAATLVFLFYHLAKDPSQIQKLRAELRNLHNVSDSKALQSLNHLNGLINETLRLYPPVPSGTLRKTPSEGVTIAGQYIPGETTVVAPNHSIARLESCFEHPNDFIPERWYSQPQLVKDKTAFAPFSIGPYSCVGKQLALMELRTVTALLISKYDVAFAPGEDGTTVLANMKDTFTVKPGALNLVFTPLEKA